VPVKYQERVGQSNVTGDMRKTIRLGLEMIRMCLRERLRAVGGTGSVSGDRGGIG
jgi:hypothetical protein